MLKIHPHLRILALFGSSLLNIPFPGGAAVAQLAVNELVVGSNPTLGAI